MNILQRSLVLFISIIALTSCNKINDFDLLCGYFDNLTVENNKKEFSSEQKFQFINELVKKNISTNSPARESWQAVIGFLPAEGRYALYKEAAEVTLNKNWHCSSMQILLSSF